MKIIFMFLLLVNTLEFVKEFMMKKGKFTNCLVNYVIEIGAAIISCICIEKGLWAYAYFIIGIENYNDFLPSQGAAVRYDIVIIQFLSIFLYLTTALLQTYLCRFFNWTIHRIRKSHS